MTDADRIKDRLRTCKTASEIEAVAGEEREAVKAMHEAGGEARTLAIQIVNLKAWKLGQLRSRLGKNSGDVGQRDRGGRSHV